MRKIVFSLASGVTLISFLLSTSSVGVCSCYIDSVDRRISVSELSSNGKAENNGSKHEDKALVKTSHSNSKRFSRLFRVLFEGLGIAVGGFIGWELKDLSDRKKVKLYSYHNCNYGLYGRLELLDYDYNVLRTFRDTSYLVNFLEKNKLSAEEIDSSDILEDRRRRHKGHEMSYEDHEKVYGKFF